MRIGVVNVYKGCWEEEKFRLLVEFIKQQRLDIVGILEANEWGKERLRVLADQTGLEHYFFGKANSQYDLALLSQLQMNAENLAEGFKHTCIKTEVGGVLIFLVHLSPDSEDDRLREVDMLLKHIGDQPEKVVVMGDMNSLSLRDKRFYDADGLWGKCLSAGVTKFGEKALRFEVIRRVLDGNLVDMGKRFEEGKLEYTTPTPVNKDKYHLASLRLDYIFVSPDLVSKVKGFTVIRDEITEQMSDHFPVIVSLE